MAVKSIVAVLGIALASTAAASAQTQAPLAGTYDVSDEGLVKSLPGFISSFATVNASRVLSPSGRYQIRNQLTTLSTNSEASLESTNAKELSCTPSSMSLRVAALIRVRCTEQRQHGPSIETGRTNQGYGIAK